MADLTWIFVLILAALLLIPAGLIALTVLALALLSPVILVFLIYFLILLRPQGKKPSDERLLCPYAHRGLHGDGVPENSLEAFRLAIDAGYGIELDVQTTRDGAVVVFHDYNLSRMTGKDALLSDLTLSELKTLRLSGTEETIPTLTEVLALVNGRVPLLVELKGEDLNTALCQALTPLLAAYDGPFCVESFNPMLLRSMRKCMPRVYRGLLYTNVYRGRNDHPIVNFFLVSMMTNCLARPNFIAFNKLDRRSPALWLATKCYRAPRFIWTVQTPEEMNEARSRGECPIFERVRPQ